MSSWRWIHFGRAGDSKSKRKRRGTSPNHHQTPNKHTALARRQTGQRRPRQGHSIRERAAPNSSEHDSNADRAHLTIWGSVPAVVGSGDHVVICRLRHTPSDQSQGRLLANDAERDDSAASSQRWPVRPIHTGQIYANGQLFHNYLRTRLVTVTPHHAPARGDLFFRF